MNLGCAKIQPPNISQLTKKLDSLILHPFLGIPIFLCIIYIVFSITIQGGGKIQSLLSYWLQYLFIEQVGNFLQAIQAADWIIVLLTKGLGQGIHTTLSFIPVIALMFFCLSLLETIGYMQRAALVMDKMMQSLGLSGQSFMPMILGFGCNVPAILGTRSLKEPRQRILTILMTPFMSCGARLAIYALFVSAFFQENGTNIIFALYLVGILMALLTAWSLGKSLLNQGNQAKQVNQAIELPPYRVPQMQKLIFSTFTRVKSFVLNAGLIIIPLCVLIGGLSLIDHNRDQESYMTKIGRNITPIFAPMGIEENNWPATVGLLSGLLAKEVVVGTLTALYTEPNYVKNMKNSVKNNSNENENINGNENVNANGLSTMAKSFGSTKAAFAYLLFVLLYFPCISVLATISRELNMTWAIFTSIWTTGLAYGVAVLFYQVASFNEHPESSLLIISTVLLALGLGLMAMKTWAKQVIKKQSKSIFPTPIIILGS